MPCVVSKVKNFFPESSLEAIRQKPTKNPIDFPSPSMVNRFATNRSAQDKQVLPLLLVQLEFGSDTPVQSRTRISAPESNEDTQQYCLNCAKFG
ncbi:hypothetical protein M0802_013063 [Mischocyttarus mexicanus]|nr:hypothetical protein M0802_013063 [Mischocyttarus mexicanus]